MGVGEKGGGGERKDTGGEVVVVERERKRCVLLETLSVARLSHVFRRFDERVRVHTGRKKVTWIDRIRND